MLILNILAAKGLSDEGKVFGLEKKGKKQNYQ
jgi:hypothetical protein